MAEHPNQTKFLNVWNGFFGDKQKELWERGAEIIAPVLIKAYLNHPLKRHLDGKTITPGTEIAWVATNEAKKADRDAKILSLLTQIAETPPNQPVVIDYPRMGKEAAAAMAEFVTSIDTVKFNIKEA